MTATPEPLFGQQDRRGKGRGKDRGELPSLLQPARHSPAPIQYLQPASAYTQLTGASSLFILESLFDSSQSISL